jgi:predicted acetyltransferase
MEFKSASLNELDQVIGLSIETFKPNMKEQFRLLFSADNLDHMMIAKDHEIVVSEVNYYPSTIQIPNASIKVASIGSVCTKIDYRGKQIASQLLLMAEAQMLKEHIGLTIISGDLGIYERFGARDVGHMHQFTLHSSHYLTKHPYHYRVYQPSDLKVMHDLYQREDIRFDRSESEFEALFLGQTYPDTYCKYPTYIITKHEIPVAYMILSVYVDDDFIKIKEFAGNRQACAFVIPDLLKLHQKSKITWVVPPKDKIHDFLVDMPYSVITQRATLKINHLGYFFQSIEPYILSLFKPFGILFSSQTEIKLSIANQTITLNQEQALKMVLSGKTHLRSKSVLQFVHTCFPLPMPWTHNLNYQ